jgi:peptidyl-prolyl cis-trans isomerase SurA
MDQESVEQQVSDQVLIDQLVADEAGGSEPTDREVQQYYDQLVAQQGQAGGSKIPPLAKVRPQLVEQLKTQQQSQVAQQLVTSLREDADVTVNL